MKLNIKEVVINKPKNVFICVFVVVIILIITLLFFLLPIPDTNRLNLYDEGVVAYKNGDYGKAVKVLSLLAHEGDKAAMMVLGDAYSFGHGANINRELAKYLYFSLDQNQFPVSEVFFYNGKTFEEGKYVERNYQQAFFGIYLPLNVEMLPLLKLSRMLIKQVNFMRLIIEKHF